MPIKKLKKVSSENAIFAFGVDSVVKKGDCAYRPKDKDDYMKCTEDFYGPLDSEKGQFTVECKPKDEKSFVLVIKYTDEVPNPSLRGKNVERTYAYPEKFGRGEWTAHSLDDAMEMARDFANGVA